MNIIGLGQCGCNIAKCFEQYPQYDVYYINTEKVKSKEYLFPEQQYYSEKEQINIGKTFLMPERDSHEEYEENCPDFTKFFKKVKDEVLFVIGGSGAISGACLKILEYLKHCEITIAYIRPEIMLLSEKKTLQEKVVYNILQEYTRSGLFKDIYLFSNTKLEEVVSDITILNRFDKLNEVISSSLHMINVFKNTKPIMSTISEFSDIARIGSIGSFDYEENSEILYFSLDNICEKCYYYAIPEKQLKEDTELFRKITEQMREKAEDEIKVSYMIHSTDYDHAYCYAISKSSQVQQ